MKPTIGQRIAIARKAAGLNQSELARLCDVTPQAIQKWEASGFAPRYSRMENLAEILGTSVSFLLGEQVDEDMQPLPDKTVRVKLMANAASMGAGEADMEDTVIGSLSLTGDFARELKSSSIDNLRFIHAKGDSMSPTLKSGDVVLVDTGIEAVDIDGIYVLRVHDRLFIKRVRQRMDGQFEVSSDNPNQKTVDVLNGDTSIEVLGRVVYLWNGHKVA